MDIFKNQKYLSKGLRSQCSVFLEGTKMTLFMSLSEPHDHTYIDTDRIVMSLQSI